MKPQVIVHELGKRLSNTAILSADSGTCVTWWARQIPLKRGQQHYYAGLPINFPKLENQFS